MLLFPMEVNGYCLLITVYGWLQPFFKIYSFVFNRINKLIHVSNNIRVSKWWQHFHFWVNYPIPYIVNTYTNNQNNSNYLYVYYFLIYMLTLFFIDHLRIFFQKSHSHLFSHRLLNYKSNFLLYTCMEKYAMMSCNSTL